MKKLNKIEPVDWRALSDSLIGLDVSIAVPRFCQEITDKVNELVKAHNELKSK